MQPENLQHRKVRLGPLPLLGPVLERLRFRKIVGSHLKNERYARALELLVQSILVEPAALYRIPEWAASFATRYVGEESVRDDVLGRALDKLFQSDRASLQTQLTVNAIQGYGIDTSTIHNDTTTVKFHGAYKRQSPRAVKLRRGHSKDHRPDLLQIVYNLSIAEDGAVPVHFKCHDGNVTDDQLHIETWLTLRGLLGRSDFLYVADSKLCTTKNMRTIDREGGRFVTMVPETRAETKEFAEQCYQAEARWLPLTRRRSTRYAHRFDVFQVAEGFHQLAEGFRLYWYRSSEKRKRDQESREERMAQAMAKLEDLEAQPHRGRRTEASLQKKAQAILDRYQAAAWIRVEVKSREVERFVQTAAGKPGPHATYRRKVKRVPDLVVTPHPEALARAAAIDGIFPLTTNAKLDAKEALQAYKYQPYLEKRYSGLKSDYVVAPVFLKKTERIEALMFAHFIADLVAALVQRALRQAMKETGVTELCTLPEERPSPTPTWEQLQRLFLHQSQYELRDKDKLVKTFSDPLTHHQRQVLELLDVPTSAYVR